jgi:hypothetical protein
MARSIVNSFFLGSCFRDPLSVGFMVIFAVDTDRRRMRFKRERRSPMSGTLSMQKSRRDGYAGLITALDSNRERTRKITKLGLRSSSHHLVASSLEPQRNDSPRRHIRCMMIANLRSTAFFASLAPKR